MSTTPSSRRSAIYLRQSLDATGERLAIDRQREDCTAIVNQRGWNLVETYTDNSISASDKSKGRPGYERMVRDYAEGRFDALVCYDLDRLTRQPRQLEDWIDAAEEHGLLLVTANGEADLSTDGGRLFARIKASVARAEVERKAARQTRAAQQRADRGRPPTGVRLTGYTTAGEIDPDEARVVREMFERFIGGDSLRGIANWLTADGRLKPRHGGTWPPSTVRTMLRNPRYAGRAIYRGEQTGKSGVWKPIVNDVDFDVVQARLADPRRRTNHDTTNRKHLGAGLYVCGVCGGRVRSHSGGRYRCPEGGHITRLAASIDSFVLGVMRERLSRPDVANLLDRGDDAVVQAFNEEARTLRRRIEVIEGDYDAGRIDGRRYAVASAKVGDALSQVERSRARAAGGAAISGVIGARDPVKAFDQSDLFTKRAVVEALLCVGLLRTARGYKFDPSSIRIEWRQA